MMLGGDFCQMTKAIESDGPARAPGGLKGCGDPSIRVRQAALGPPAQAHAAWAPGTNSSLGNTGSGAFLLCLAGSLGQEPALQGEAPSPEPQTASDRETMMDHALRTISYIADIGNIVVLMARRRMPRSASQDCIETTPGAQEGKKQYKMICHVFESEDAIRSWKIQCTLGQHGFELRGPTYPWTFVSSRCYSATPSALVDSAIMNRGHGGIADSLRDHKPFDSFLGWDESIFLSLEEGERDWGRELQGRSLGCDLGAGAIPQDWPQLRWQGCQDSEQTGNGRLQPAAGGKTPRFPDCVPWSLGVDLLVLPGAPPGCLGCKGARVGAGRAPAAEGLPRQRPGPRSLCGSSEPKQGPPCRLCRGPRSGPVRLPVSIGCPSPQAQLIAQSIGQAFSVAYQEFLRANGINPEDLSQKEYSDIINTQEMYNDDLIHFSNSENCKEVGARGGGHSWRAGRGRAFLVWGPCLLSEHLRGKRDAVVGKKLLTLQLEKHKGEILGVVVVESGWGSILPTVILANMMNGGPAARSGKLSIGDQIMSINGTSLVGLPLATCQGIIKGLKNQTQVKLNIVSCPPVTTVLIKRPDLKYQLGFSVQNGIQLRGDGGVDVALAISVYIHLARQGSVTRPTNTGLAGKVVQLVPKMKKERVWVHLKLTLAVPSQLCDTGQVTEAFWAD
ncbi:hypothetical protein J1605_002225 [Eschrichtius robustus]|uniref:Amyloid beta A4 protein-binding family A member 2 n=1 Tax=Eschrichtius robustus TaxID=9764 RepID=A0AB34HZM0_ESCRO|nr:hypothetical protein J1605_002225 [Eschrichtius robustus]